MTAEKNIIQTKIFTNYFREKKVVTRADIKGFYAHHDPNLSEQDFRRMLNSLIQQKNIIHVNRDVYLIHNSFSPNKSKFIPLLSQSAKEVGDLLNKSFPYLDYALWETRILYEFMNHQPSQNHIIVEAQKDALESVFNSLIKHFEGRVFLDPDREMMERYVVTQDEAVIVSRIISQAAGTEIDGIYSVPLENILVDLLVDNDKFYIFQGQELVFIYENAFLKYWINEKAMLRYAGRRKAIPQLKQFILQHPEIDSIFLKEAAQ